jgi:hypothetical protein
MRVRMSLASLPGQYIYAITPEQQDALEDQGWVADPEPVLSPLAGWGITPGDLADRPPADPDLPGMAYWSRDQNGGQLDAVDPETGQYEQVAPAMADVGGTIIGSAAPSSWSSINPAFATPTRIPEFTTGSFTMPDKPVRAILSPVQLTTAADPTFTFALHWTINGWSGNTQAIIVNQHLYSAGTSRTIANISGRITATAGTTVQVGLFVTRLSASSAVTGGTGFLDVFSF